MAWAAPTAVVTYASTSLNSLANNLFSSATASSFISNETGLYQYMNLELHLGSCSPVAGGYVDVWLYPSIDAGVTAASDTSSSQGTNLFCTFPLSNGASFAQTLTVYNRAIPPLAFKLAARNMTGVQLPGTGNTLRYTLHNEA